MGHSKGTLVWSFSELAHMDEAIGAIRNAYPDAHVTVVRGQIDGNVYWEGLLKEVEYVTGICRGVAYATCDGSVNRGAS